MSAISAPIRPYVPFFPSHISDLFSVRYNEKKYELSGWEKTAIIITSIAGVLLAGVGIFLGFCLSDYLRNRLVDKLMTNKEIVKAPDHFYFDADYFDGTDKETIAPVAATQLFYQQKQISTFCSIHSLCNFAGRNIDGLVPKMIQENNEYWKNRFKDRPDGEIELEGMKQLGLYIESLQTIAQHRGMSTDNVTRYMNNNKDRLYLPKSCSIEYLSGGIDSDAMQNALETIQTDATLHRVIVSVSNKRYSHFSTIRKDASGQWRVLDSIQSIFTATKNLQPSFPTLQGAVSNLMERHNGLGRDVDLIYPSKDTPAIALKSIEAADLAAV